MNVLILFFMGMTWIASKKFHCSHGVGRATLKDSKNVFFSNFGALVKHKAQNVRQNTDPSISKVSKATIAIL